MEDILDKSKVNSKQNGNRISAYYLLEIVNDIIRLCKDFPLWTSVMKTHFNSPYNIPTSASVEGDFKELKCTILRHERKPMTADRFVIHYLNSIDSNTKIFRSSQLRNYAINKKDSNITRSEFNIFDDISDVSHCQSSETSRIILNDNINKPDDEVSGKSLLSPIHRSSSYSSSSIPDILHVSDEVNELNVSLNSYHHLPSSSTSDILSVSNDDSELNTSLGSLNASENWRGLGKESIFIDSTNRCPN